MDEYSFEWENEFLDISEKYSFNKIIEVIDDTYWLLEIIAENTSIQPQATIRGKKILTLEADFFLATNNTLKSILSCCKLGNFSDAHVLIRKYRDDLFQYLFILYAIEQIESIKYKKYDHLINEMVECFKNNLDNENILRIIERILYEENKRNNTHLENGITAWFDNTLNDKIQKEYYGVQKYKNYLCKNDLVKKCFDLYLNEIWISLNTELNNYIHSNGRNYVRNNIYNYLQNNNIEKMLDKTIKNIWQTTVCFLSIVILIKPNYIMASDIVDYLDCGLTPPEDSQYWVANAVQKYIDTYIIKINPKLKEYLVNENLYNMKIQ